MEVEVLSETVQRFNGETFYRCGQYFQHKGRRLHRVVWEYHNGEIPNGHHVHHVDQDKTNNQISNLECVPASEHLSEHGKQSKHERALAVATEHAKAWHGSDEGRQWHKEHYEKTKQNLYRKFTCQCEICGREFESTGRKGKYCGPVCRARSFRLNHPGYVCGKRRKG